MYGHRDEAGRKEIALFDWSLEDEETRREFLEVHVKTQEDVEATRAIGPSSPTARRTQVEVLGTTRAAGVTHALVALRGELRTSWTRASEGREASGPGGWDITEPVVPLPRPLEGGEHPPRMGSTGDEGDSVPRSAGDAPRERRFGGRGTGIRVVRRGRTRSRTQEAYARAGIDFRELRSPEFVDGLPGPKSRAYSRGSTNPGLRPPSEAHGPPGWQETGAEVEESER